MCVVIDQEKYISFDDDVDDDVSYIKYVHKNSIDSNIQAIT